MLAVNALAKKRNVKLHTLHLLLDQLQHQQRQNKAACMATRVQSCSSARWQ